MGITVCKVVQINGLRLLNEGVVASMTLEVAHLNQSQYLRLRKQKRGVKA